MIENDRDDGVISIHRLFKYGSRKDKVMLGIGTVAAALAGLLIPSIALIMGKIATTFGSDN